MGVGECWGSLRGPLREYFSFSDIKEIAGAAGLAIQRLGHLQQRQGPGGASKGQLIDELDRLFTERPPEAQDQITAATIREMVRRVHPSRLQGMEEQMSGALAAHGWGLRSGEACPLPPPGQSVGVNDPPIRRVDARAAFATATGVNEIPAPLREAAERARRGRALGRAVTVGGQQYEISGLGYGTLPTWDFIKKDGAPLGREPFLALPSSDRQELFDQVRDYATTSLGGRVRIDPVGVPGAGRVGGGFTAPAGSSLFNSSALNTAPFNSGPNPAIIRNTDENGVALNVAPGPEVNLSAEARVSTFGEREEVSGAVGGAALNTLAVNADSGPAASTAPLSARGGRGASGKATLSLSGPPPEVPEPGPAMINPVWVEGRLALLKGLPANDMADEGVVNLIAAVRRGFERFIGALSKPGTNLHPSLRSYIEGVPELLVGVPDQVQVFEMGHAVEHLEAQHGVIEDELGAQLSNEYRVLVAQFRRCVEKFPCWRELVSGANADPLPFDQAEHAVPAARALAAALKTDEAGAVVDPSVAEALTALADAASKAATPAEKGLLDFDLVSSIRRIMTALYQPVIYCWNEVGSGAWSALNKLPSQVGSGAVKWGGGTLLAIAALHVGAAPLAATVATLPAHYPTLTWLPAVEEFLKFLASLPKG